MGEHQMVRRLCNRMPRAKNRHDKHSISDGTAKRGAHEGDARGLSPYTSRKLMISNAVVLPRCPTLGLPADAHSTDAAARP